MTSGEAFDLEQFARTDNLHIAYRKLEAEGGHGAGTDGLTFADFSSREVFGALRVVSNTLASRTYRPFETRTVLIPKPNGKHRTLSLQCLTDRTVAKALQLAVSPFLHTEVTGRPRSVWEVYADLQDGIRSRQAYVLATDDVRDCFPTAPLDAVLPCFEAHIAQPDLLWLIDCVVRGHDGPAHTFGLDQGSPFSPDAMELLLHTCLDAPLNARGQGNPLQLRYVDNLTYLCRSEREGRETLQMIGEILEKTGFQLKREDDPPGDLRDPRHERVVLGLLVGWDDGQLKFSIPEQGYTDLRQGLTNALNHSPPTEYARSVVNGWINAVGPTLTNKARPEVVSRVTSIARECGIREISERDLLNQAHQARQRWLKLSSHSMAGRRKGRRPCCHCRMTMLSRRLTMSSLTMTRLS